MALLTLASLNMIPILNLIKYRGRAFKFNKILIVEFEKVLQNISCQIKV